MGSNLTALGVHVCHVCIRADFTHSELNAEGMSIGCSCTENQSMVDKMAVAQV